MIDFIKKRDPDQPEFHQAVKEVYESIKPAIERNPRWSDAGILERIAEPNRTIIFRVPWVDDKGKVRVNRGFRVQMNDALGPYKGGLRFHPSVNLGILKFLAFEQTIKNALTGLPMGGAKGGSDFDPKGKSEGEIMRFCQSFMLELFRHIGPNTDVPAGDIGVGEREIGYMFGMYKRLRNEFTGVITGKGLDWGGSHIRSEATGYGLVYFAEEMLKGKGDSLAGKRCSISGSGSVAQYTDEKLIEYGTKASTMSDSDGFIFDPDGIGRDKLNFIMELKNVRRGRIDEYYEEFLVRTGGFYESRPLISDHHPIWAIPCDCAFPCATENELNKKDAINLIKGGCKLVAEGANMPCTPGAIKAFREAGVMYAPGKAANAGGVGTSCLEMQQNHIGDQWPRKDVDAKLHQIMRHIHTVCLEAAQEYGQPGNYEVGANIAGFTKVANAMMDQGIV